FNSLRELGGARRVIEDEVGNRVSAYGNRIRISEKDSPFANRKIAYEVVELTSRVSTDKVADAKRKLGVPFSDSDRVDVAIATNMISVGLDITRLGLMVVYGQPFTTAEYIQCTSRVGRDHNRPGLVVTILNIHKPRDRSYYERFTSYHETFYRSVEVTSVTPFSPRALDRALAGSLISLARLGIPTMTPPLGAGQILNQRQIVENLVIPTLTERAFAHDKNMSQSDAVALKSRVRDRCMDLLDAWARIALDLSKSGVNLQYQTETGAAQRLLYEFLNPELKQLPSVHKKFRANRSMRDVEPSVNVWVKTFEGLEVEEEGE
ncbi:MAG: hypothetical protein K8F91_20815, partial [Candidatus Obscuribacterales bacterium]|nr:hypothetical protein [Candidatus Obscuribacterales bacterium]